MNKCYLALGSNQKNPERQLRNAMVAIKRIPQTYLKKRSSLYWTAAWGLQAQQDYCNAVVEIETRLSPQELLGFCQKIEQTQGRVRRKRWGPRVLDIDIILYGARQIKSKNLCIPHPYFMERDFVLNPLCEINPIFLAAVKPIDLKQKILKARDKHVLVAELELHSY